jgi:hypothetical protein
VKSPDVSPSVNGSGPNDRGGYADVVFLKDRRRKINAGLMCPICDTTGHLIVVDSWNGVFDVACTRCWGTFIRPAVSA